MKSQNLGKPWFKQFWPWFIISIPACGVIAGIATVIIATQNAPHMTQNNIGRFARVTENPVAISETTVSDSHESSSD